MLFLNDLGRVIEQVGRDKGIDQEILIEALEVAMLTAAKKLYGERDFEAHFNEEQGEIEVFEFKEVAVPVEEPDTQISLDEAQKIDPEAEPGDMLGMKLSSEEFGRISAQTAKQVIIQRVREAEREIIFSDYRERKGQIVSGIVRRYEKGNLIIDLGRAESILPNREQIPRENFRIGDRVRAFCLDVAKQSKGPQIILSRTHPTFLVELFRQEVPEIAEGIVEIKGAAREPGVRSKIAVHSNDRDVDPIGACVGMKGARVQAVVQELRGEKVDIVPWSPDPARFVMNALSPAEIEQVIIEEQRKAMEVIVPDDQLSLAIGRKGQNVRLAVQLTGWSLDIKSETEVARQREAMREVLDNIDGLSVVIYPLLAELGFTSLRSLAFSRPEELTEIDGVDEEKAGEIIIAARIHEGLPEDLDFVDEPLADHEYLENFEVAEQEEVTTGGDQEIVRLPGIGLELATILKDGGYETFQALITADAAEVAEKTGIKEKMVLKLVKLAKENL